jgi:hypothetical protein
MIEVQTKKNISLTNKLVPDALAYYDKNFEKYGDLFKNIKYIKFQDVNDDINHNQIIMFDSDKNLLFSSGYEVIGVYTSRDQAWVWSWAISKFRKKTTSIARKIINYGMELDPESKFLKTELTNSRFRISNKIQLEIHVAIASYLAKKPLIFNYVSFINFFNRDKDGFIDITKKAKDDGEYSIYFMFIMDYESIIPK